LKIFYTDDFVIPLPEGHRFPMEKYSLLRQKVCEAGLVPPEDLYVPHAVTDEEILRVHDPEYLRRVQYGELTEKEIRRIGFPWSMEMVERARRSCGATIEVCRLALEDGLAISLAGGTHHAFQDYGQGYCVFNDSAIASFAMQAEGRAVRVVVIDCDAHQGNGTASILQNNATVFTFSIHAHNGFPFRKEKSDLDIPLHDGVDDATYLDALEEGVIRALKLAEADLAIYLAGADPYMDDRFGRLSLTKEGLANRDRLVLHDCHDAGLPVAITMGGGYAPQIQDTVDIHFQTVRIAVDMQKQKPQLENRRKNGPKAEDLI
jgi:acetoin utilization deacetylase AcuC-like enzyme